MHEVDVVFDPFAGDVQQRSWKTLKRGGVLVSTQPPSETEAARHGVRGARVFVQPNAGQLSEIAALAEARRLRPTIETVLPLAEAREAQRLSRAGHVRGKIVLRVEENQ